MGDTPLKTLNSERRTPLCRCNSKIRHTTSITKSGRERSKKRMDDGVKEATDSLRKIYPRRKSTEKTNVKKNEPITGHKVWRSQVYKDWYRRSGNVHTFCNAYTPLRYLILATSSRQPYLVSRPIAWSTNVERWKETRRRLSITLREETSREEGKKEETSGEGGSIRRRLYLYKRPTRFWKVFDVFVENVQRDDWIRFCDIVENNRYLLGIFT